MKTVFFCGHKSPYGFSHLEPLLNSDLNVTKVVIADNERWSMFRNVLGGKNFYKQNSLLNKIFDNAKIIIKKILKSPKTNNDIFDVCKNKNIEIECVNDVNNEDFIRKISKENFDIFISAAYPQIFSEKLLNVPPLGAINFHPSALPKFRGAHPHFWSLYTGYHEGGVTAHYMTPRIDDGDIVSQIKFPIADLDYAMHYDRIIKETPNIVKNIEDFILSGSNEVVRQDPRQVSYFRNDRQIHHRIFWGKKSAKEIVNMVRAGNAFFVFNGHKVNVLCAFAQNDNRNMTNEIEVPEGAVVDFGDGNFVVKCKEGFLNLELLRVGRRNFVSHRFARKFNVQIGSVL